MDDPPVEAPPVEPRDVEPVCWPRDIDPVEVELPIAEPLPCERLDGAVDVGLPAIWAMAGAAISSASALPAAKHSECLVMVSPSGWAGVAAHFINAPTMTNDATREALGWEFPM